MGFDKYFSDERYFEVYKDVSSAGVNLDRFFFVLAESFNFIKENKGSPSKVLREVSHGIDPYSDWNRVLEHRLFRSEKMLLIFHLARLLRQEWESQTEIQDKELEQCSAVVEGYLERFLMRASKKRVMQEVRFAVKRRKYDFKEVKKNLDQLSDDESQLRFLYEIAADARRERDFCSEHKDEFFEMIIPEINKLEKLLALKQPSKQSNLADEQTETSSLSIEVGKIKWLGTEVELAYLINQLVKEGLLDDNKKWHQVEHHFINKLGKPFNHKQTATVASQGEPKNKHLLDNIIEEVKKQP